MATNAKDLPKEDRDKALLEYAIERTMEFTPIGEAAPLKINVAMALKYLSAVTKKGHRASEEDVMKFLHLCKAAKLNPWVRDAYLVGYDSQDGPTFSVITAYQALAKRAELHPQYDGIESGIIVECDGTVEEREGCFRLDHEKLLGGWARVYRRDKAKPFYVAIRKAPYAQENKFWKGNPDWMICKCAKAGAMREAFPNELGGLYIREEMGQEEVLPRAIAETERTRKESSAKKSKVSASDLVRQPAPEQQEAKAQGELELELARCKTQDEVADVRIKWTDKLKVDDLDGFDRVNDLCDIRGRELAAREVEQEMLFDGTPNAAEA